MTPQAFVSKWGPGGPSYGLNEEQGAQRRFLVRCVQDAAVAAAYGWSDLNADTHDDELLARLLALNLQRAA